MNTTHLVMSRVDTPSVSQQIALQFRLQIASGTLLPGSRLPSIRQLAQRLQLAPNTIVRAYDELQGQGWIVCAARKGSRVGDPLPLSEGQRALLVAQALDQAIERVLVAAQQCEMTVAELHEEIERQYDSAIVMRGKSHT
jgi:GntR family transcriptional regulator